LNFKDAERNIGGEEKNSKVWEICLLLLYKFVGKLVKFKGLK
jgi:hypothetical protein